MTITKADAERLSGTRATLHYAPACSRERVERWRVNGQVKLWKRSPERFRLPVKFGLYAYSAVDELNGDDFHHEEDCPFREEQA